MIRFGIVGTNWITDEFIRCAMEHSEFELSAVYSRSADKGMDFISRHGGKVKLFTDMAAMAASNLIDAVYIASPNSCHAEQSLAFLRQHKAVLCEKSSTVNTAEMEKVIKAARLNKTAYMEAMKSTHQPGMQAIKASLGKLGTLRRYIGNYCQYSSRYDAYKNGVNNNTFNLKLGNGALMDLGVYCLYPMVYLFGQPEKILASCVKLPSGVDGETALICQYESMDAVITCSKITASQNWAEIQGENATLRFKMINEIAEAEIIYNDKQKAAEKLVFASSDKYMYYELAAFIDVINNGLIEDTENSFTVSLSVRKIMDEARRQMELVFPNDR